MIKETYASLEMEVIIFEANDAITTYEPLINLIPELLLMSYKAYSYK